MGYVGAPGGSDAVHEDREVVGSTEPSDRRTRHARSTDPMAERYVVSHAEAAKVLRKAGYSQQRIQELLRDFPIRSTLSATATKSSSRDINVGAHGSDGRQPLSRPEAQAEQLREADPRSAFYDMLHRVGCSPFDRPTSRSLGRYRLGSARGAVAPSPLHRSRPASEHCWVSGPEALAPCRSDG